MPSPCVIAVEIWVRGLEHQRPTLKCMHGACAYAAATSDCVHTTAAHWHADLQRFLRTTPSDTPCRPDR